MEHDKQRLNLIQVTLNIYQTQQHDYNHDHGYMIGKDYANYYRKKIQGKKEKIGSFIIR